MEKELLARGLSSSKRSRSQIFKGIGGKIEPKHVRVFPMGIYKVHGEIHSAETPGNTPLLLSRPFMEELGAVINLADQTISFLAINVNNMPMCKTSKGHLALNLLDFNMDKLDEFMSEAEEEKENQKPSEASGEQPPDQFDPAQDPEYLSWLESTAPHEYTHDYGGLNPDEFEDHQDILAMMKMDVQGYDECHFVCDDETLFADIASKEYRVRKTTNKKWKRICGMEQALEGEDFLHRRVLQGQLSKIPRQPHFGRCWIKQLFAGQMGLTLLAALIGMACGAPLDYNISGWDATTSLGKKQLHHDMMHEDRDPSPLRSVGKLVPLQPCQRWPCARDC